jgi:hypothetical protein
MALEKITGETCVNKVLSMRSKLLTDELEKCRYKCDGNYRVDCPNYQPIKITQIPIRQGGFYVGNN